MARTTFSVNDQVSPIVKSLVQRLQNLSETGTESAESLQDFFNGLAKSLNAVSATQKSAAESTQELSRAQNQLAQSAEGVEGLDDIYKAVTRGVNTLGSAFQTLRKAIDVSDVTKEQRAAFNQLNKDLTGIQKLSEQFGSQLGFAESFDRAELNKSAESMKRLRTELGALAVSIRAQDAERKKASESQEQETQTTQQSAKASEQAARQNKAETRSIQAETEALEANTRAKQQNTRTTQQRSGTGRGFGNLGRAASFIQGIADNPGGVRDAIRFSTDPLRDYTRAIDVGRRALKSFDRSIDVSTAEVKQFEQALESLQRATRNVVFRGSEPGISQVGESNLQVTNRQAQNLRRRASSLLSSFASAQADLPDTQRDQDAQKRQIEGQQALNKARQESIDILKRAGAEQGRAAAVVDETIKGQQEAGRSQKAIAESLLESSKQVASAKQAETQATNQNTQAQQQNKRAADADTKSDQQNTRSTQADTDATQANTKATNENTQAQQRNRRAAGGGGAGGGGGGDGREPPVPQRGRSDFVRLRSQGRGSINLSVANHREAEQSLQLLQNVNRQRIAGERQAQREVERIIKERESQRIQSDKFVEDQHRQTRQNFIRDEKARANAGLRILREEDEAIRQQARERQQARRQQVQEDRFGVQLRARSEQQQQSQRRQQVAEDRFSTQLRERSEAAALQSRVRNFAKEIGLARQANTIRITNTRDAETKIQQIVDATAKRAREARNRQVTEDRAASQLRVRSERQTDQEQSKLRQQQLREDRFAVQLRERSQAEALQGRLRNFAREVSLTREANTLRVTNTRDTEAKVQQLVDATSRRAREARREQERAERNQTGGDRGGAAAAREAARAQRQAEREAASQERARRQTEAQSAQARARQFAREIGLTREANTIRITNAAETEAKIQQLADATRRKARTAIREQSKEQSDAASAQVKEQRNLEQQAQRTAQQVNRARREIEVGLLELFFTLHSIGRPIGQIANALAAFSIGNVQAAAQLEKFSSTLITVSGDAITAERTLNRLLEITVDLAAIDTGTLVQFSSRLQNAGLTARQAESVIVGVTKRMEEQGKGANETSRVLEQFTQAINSNTISMQDFRPILREYPGLYVDFSEALGATITDLDSMRDAAEASGGATQAIVQGLTHVSQVAEGARINTVSRQLDELRDRFFNAQRSLGEAFLPAFVSVLKAGNRALEIFEGLNAGLKALISSLILGAAAAFKLAQGFIQAGIIFIVITQMEVAVFQINQMTESLNRMTVAAGGAAAGIAQLPPALQRATVTIQGVKRFLPGILVGLGAVLALVSAISAIVVHVRRRTREATEEAKRFVTVLTGIPRAFSSGDDAIRNQIDSLQEYRLELLNTTDEIRKNTEAFIEQQREIGRPRRILEQQIREDNPFGAVGLDFIPDERLPSNLQAQLREIEQSLIETSQSGQNLGNIADQTEKLDQAISILQSSVGNLEERFVGINRVLEIYRGLANDARVAGDEDAFRRVARAAKTLNTIYLQLQQDFNNTRAVKNLEIALIDIDFAIRRLEESFGQFDPQEIVDTLGGFDTSGITFNANAIIAALREEANLRRQIAQQRFDQSEQSAQNSTELATELHRINTQLAFDIESTNRKLADEIDNIEEESVERRAKRLNDYLKFVEDDADKRRAAEEKLAEELQQLDERRIRSQISRVSQDNTAASVAEQIRLLRQLANIRAEIIRESVADERLANAQIEKIILESEDRIFNIKRQYNERIRQSQEEEVQRTRDLLTTIAQQFEGLDIGSLFSLTEGDRGDLVRQQTLTNLTTMSRLIGGATEKLEELTDAANDAEFAFRRTADATGFAFQEPEQRGVTREDTTALRSSGVKDQIDQITELQDSLIDVTEDANRANNRIFRNFGRGLSRVTTDFIFDANASLSEFVSDFAEQTFRVILHARINAEIQKRISDDVTEHQLRNIRRVTSEQVRQGQSATSLSATGQLASLSPASGLASGSGIGLVALAGLAIVPFIVRAIQDGFEDTTVELDGREVGKVTANHINRLARSGEVRL